jgi:hypothetical protein
MVITDPKQKPEKALKVARSVTSFINAIFASSIVELTRQCKTGKVPGQAELNLRAPSISFSSPKKRKKNVYVFEKNKKKKARRKKNKLSSNVAQ